MKLKYFFSKIKKSALYVVSASCLMGTAVACNDKLEEDIYGYWGEDFYSSTTNLNMGVRGVLSVFSTLNVYGQAWMVFDCDTDISHVQGSGTGHVARDLGHYNIQPSSPWLEAAYGKYYEGINRANIILQNKDRVVVEDTDRDRKLYKNLIAETRALRALAYFDLIRLFGDVPYKDTYTKITDNMNYNRDSKAVIYERIVEDLEAAAQDLYWYDEVPGGYKGRFSKSAAYALLVRVNMFRAGWSLQQNGNMERYPEYLEYYKKAVHYADILINSGKHALNPSYERVFRNMCELQLEPKENIYEIQFYSKTATNVGSSNMGTYNGPSIADGSSFGRANSFIKTHHFFYDSFDVEDKRRDVAVATWRVQLKDGANVFSEIARKQSYTWSPGKWRRNWHTDTPLDPNNTNVNWLYIRYADVLLMKAEAENALYSTPTKEAMECVNMVKRRGFGKDPLVADIEVDYKLQDYDANSFFELIMDERAKELCFEGDRRQDLIRWNRLGRAMAETRKKFDDAIAANELNKYDFDGATRYTPGKHELYPVPAREILETGNRWQQNPKY